VRSRSTAEGLARGAVNGDLASSRYIGAQSGGVGVASQLKQRSIDDETAAAPEDNETLLWRDAVRVRALARPIHDASRPPRAIRWALLAAIVVHLLILLGLREAMRPPPVNVEQNIRVELIDLAPPEPAPPQPPPIPAKQAIAHVAPAPVRRTTAPMPVKTPEPEEAESIHIFNLQGDVDIPKDLAEQIDNAKPKPSFIAKTIAPSPILNPPRALRVRPNHFSKQWVDNEGLAGLVNQLTTSKEFTTPWGTKVECGVSFLMLMGGCGWYTPSPYYVPVEKWKPATELDER
jgi:hypothetical protein